LDTGTPRAQLLEHAHLVLLQRAPEDLSRLHRPDQRAGEDVIDRLADLSEFARGPGEIASSLSP